jgi:hypothetical protein
MIRVFTYNLMLNAGKIIPPLRDKKDKYSNSCVVRKKISERNTLIFQLEFDIWHFFQYSGLQSR